MNIGIRYLKKKWRTALHPRWGYCVPSRKRNMRNAQRDAKSRAAERSGTHGGLPLPVLFLLSPVLVMPRSP